MSCKVLVIGDSSEFLSSLRDVELFEIHTASSFSDVRDYTDIESVIVLSGSNVSFNMPHDSLISLQNIKFKFVVCNTTTRELNHTYLEREGFKLLFNTSGYNRLVYTIATEVLGQQQKDRIFAFYGADRKVGLTNICQSICTSIATNTDKVVLYVDLAGHCNYGYSFGKEVSFSEAFSSIHDITAKLRSKILTSEELLDSALKIKDNYYVLQGFRNLALVRHFGDDEVRYLFDVCKSVADIVIVDAGSPSDCVVNLSALGCTQNRFLVTTEGRSALNNFSNFRKQVLAELRIDSFNIILNKMLDTSNKYKTDISEIYNAGNVVAVVPFSDKYTSSEMNQSCLFDIDQSSKFRNSVLDISNFILQYIDSGETMIQRRNLLSGLIGKRG